MLGYHVVAVGSRDALLKHELPRIIQKLYGQFAAIRVQYHSRINAFSYHLHRAFEELAQGFAFQQAVAQ